MYISFVSFGPIFVKKRVEYIRNTSSICDYDIVNFEKIRDFFSFFAKHFIYCWPTFL